jgi:hypothetical protein
MFSSSSGPNTALSALFPQQQQQQQQQQQLKQQ